MISLLITTAFAGATLGVNLHPPAKDTDNGWREFGNLVQEIPRGAPVRIDALWHEMNWQRDAAPNYGPMRAKLRAVAPIGGIIVIEVAPLPWPGSGWRIGDRPWGYVDEADLEPISDRYAQNITAMRNLARQAGISEERLRFQIGNEPGSGHPGGYADLPRGQWWERTGRLYVKCLKKADFGNSQVISPALSFQDEPPAVAARERESATPILGAMRPYVDYFATHHRFYNPSLGGDAWGAASAAVLRQRFALAASFGKPAVCTEAYAAKGDYAGSVDAAVVGFAKALPSNALVIMYRIGPGPSDPTFQLPAETFKAAAKAVGT